MRRIQIKIETLYLLALILLNVSTFYLVQSYGFYGSAVLFKPLVDPDRSLPNLGILLIGYILLHALVITRTPRRSSRKPTNHPRVDFWYSIIIGLNWFIFLTTGIGVAGTSAQSMGFLVNMLPIAPLMLIYFSDRTTQRGRHYLINLALGSLLIMLRGWSAIVVMMLIIHVFGQIKVVDSQNAPKITLAAFLTLLGYNYLYILKYYIREGIIFDSNFLIAAEYAISRVTAFQNFDYFSSITTDFISHTDGDYFFYLKEFLLAFFPKSLLGYENYKPLDNIFATQFVAAGIDGMESTGFAVTLPGVFKLATTLSPINYLAFPLFILGLYQVIFQLCATLWSPRFKYYFVITSFNLYYSGNMREFAFCIYALVIYISLSKISLHSLLPSPKSAAHPSKSTPELP